MKNRLQKILEREHQGKDNAIVSRALEERLGCKGTMIREMVNELRSAGVPICSDRNGYYIAKSREELDHTIVQLKSRVKMFDTVVDRMIADKNGAVTFVLKGGIRLKEIIKES